MLLLELESGGTTPTLRHRFRLAAATLNRDPRLLIRLLPESIPLLLFNSDRLVLLFRVIGSMMAIVLRPCEAALILSISSLGNESRMLREEMILADEEPSRFGESEAKILT
jgi:hypothetical protein